MIRSSLRLVTIASLVCGVGSTSHSAGSDDPAVRATRYRGDGNPKDGAAVSGSRSPATAQEPFDIDGRLNEGQAVAWYLANRGWAVKTANHFIIFDAEEFGVRRPGRPCLANGFLTPEEIGDHHVFALYTCYHGEIGQPAYIHQIEDSLAGITFIHNKGDRWRGSQKTMYMDPAETREVGDLDVTTIAVTKRMTSLGYLVHVDGLVIYYAGFQAEDLGEYKTGIRALARESERVDLAFLPIPEPGHKPEELFFLLRAFRPKAVLLLDPNRREHLFQGVAQSIRSAGFDAPVHCAEHPGDHFLFPSRRIRTSPNTP